MMVREQLLQAIATGLAGVSGVTGVYRSLEAALAAETLPVCVMYFISDNPTEGRVIGPIEWEMTIKVETVVRGEVPDQIAAPIVAEVHSIVMTTIGALSVEAGLVEYVGNDAEAAIGIMRQSFTVRYRTDRYDLEEVA